MHTELHQFYEEHASPTHCGTRDVHNMALPILELATALQMQALQYRRKLHAAKLAPHDGEYDGNMDRLQQRLKVLEEIAPALMHIHERAADAMTDFDHTVVDTKRNVHALAARIAAAQP